MRVVTLTVLFGVAFGCTSAPGVSDTPLSLAADLDLPMPTERLLSKAETDREQRQTKADEFDVRGDYREIYGESRPPSGPVRAVAEFENTDAVLIAWESGLGTFLLDLVTAVSAASDVWVLTWDLQESDAIRELLSVRDANLNRIRFFEFPHESFWTRDYGPISVVDQAGNTVFVDPRYYPQRRRDDAVPTLMSRYFGVEATRPALSTEGGNFMTNGEGICVVTEWLLQENPNLSSERLQQIQDQYFGCRRTIVLERLAREGTGHVDMFAKFLSPNTILVGDYDEMDPENAALLDRNVARLQDFASENSWSLNVVRIPMPAGGNGVYRSYTNSLIVNDLVIVPTYRGDRRYEDEALEIYRNSMSAGYTVVGLDAEDAIQLGGAVHCTTMGFVTAALDPDSVAIEPATSLDTSAGEDAVSPTVRSQPNLPIEDEQTTIDEIQVEANGPTFKVTLDLDIMHTYVGDLVIDLEHDDLSVNVLRNMGSGAQALVRRFEIAVPLGVERSGSWRLVIRDTASQDEGVLRSWALTFVD